MRRALGVVVGAMLALRLVWVLSFREIDSDAYGHYFIAIATRNDPANLAVHWVWLPLFHFLVGGASALGLTFRGVRVVNALLAAGAPFLLHAALVQKREASADAQVEGWASDRAFLAALTLAIAPLPMILGQSAQPETLFLGCVVVAIHQASSGRPWAAGVALALAASLRYEAWGAALALVVWWSVSALRRARAGASAADRSGGPAIGLVLVPAAVIGLYVVFRFLTDGKLLLFFRGTRDITAVQVGRAAWTFREIISFPIVLPFIVFGPVVALVPVGIAALRRTAGSRTLAVLAAGFAAFLLLSYYGGASHSGERYLVSLVPFACVAIGAGIVWLGRRLARPRLVAGVALALLGLTTAWHLRRAARMAIAWDDGLAAREAELDRLAGAHHRSE